MNLPDVWSTEEEEARPGQDLCGDILGIMEKKMETTTL